MAANIRTAQDSMLAGWVTAQKFFAEWLKEWNAPLIERQVEQTEQQLISTWDMVPPQMHAALEAQNPEVYKRAKAHLEELRRKYNDRRDRTTRRLTR